jgi:LuxR family maltose regulon positive regulatory protein
MLFEMLVAQRPFTGTTLASTLTAILTKPVPDMAALIPRAPTALHELIHQMLEKDRRRRISSARLIGARLEAIMEGPETDLKGRDATDMLVRTKLHAPPLRPNLVARSRLIKKLSGGLESKLTTVTAPAGSGKTTLLSSWVRTAESAVAWLSLDERDNDLMRFLNYFIAALQGTIDKPNFGEAAIRATQSAQLSSDEKVLTGLINELSTTSKPVTIVLDDYHLIVSQEIHQALIFLLDHMPVNLHLVIAGRSEPPLPLSRLRVRHQLTEITAVDLRFTIEESTQFLNQAMGLAVSPEEVADLESRTEGWIAGLQVAALSFQGRSDMGDLVRDFSGSHRHLLDYLADEVLAQQPPATQTF